MNFETSKYLGGIGAILLFLGFLPYASFYGVIAFIGLILVLIALKGFADYYKEAGIFNNALYGGIAAIIGAVAVVAVAIVAFVDLLSDLGISIANLSDVSALSQIDWTGVAMNTIVKFAAYILADLAVLVVFLLIAGWFVRKSLGLLSAKTRVGMFGTTGMLILIGAALTIVLVGLLLLWVAMLLLAVAFFSIKPEQAMTSTPAGTMP